MMIIPQSSQIDLSEMLKVASQCQNGIVDEKITLLNHPTLRGKVVVFPSSLDEPVYDITSFCNEANLESLLHEALCASGSSHIFSAECNRGGRIFWIEHPNSDVNERALLLAGLNYIRGDAIFVCNKILFKKRKSSVPHDAKFNTDSLDPVSYPFIEKQVKRIQPLHSTPSATIDDLPSAVLLLTFSKLKTFPDLSSCSSVCHSWRKVLGEETDIYKDLEISRNERDRSGRTACSCHNLPFKLHRKHSIAKDKDYNVPFILLHAARAGNANAAFLLAEEFQKLGRHVLALEWFKKAARNGHQLSQFKVGESLYRGENGLCRDEEEALSWLSRAFKNSSANKSIRASSALLIGYMHLDGEGTTRVDNTEAVKWLKLARDNGSVEAAKMVGWLWNTGQY